jgi:4-diphosphocytidyl-2-C-methyl-D-erythritol kinase
MEKAVLSRAPAKVNLHLGVYGRRQDGYHEISSIFQAISLADELVVRSLKEPECIRIDGVFDCPPEKTTLYGAIVAFRAATGCNEGVSVEARKAIPAGAGMGGGSSDAASLLIALDALFETGLDAARLESIGARIGSDVPFFVRGGAAIVTGRGETVEPIAARQDFSLVVVFPGFPVRTADAYDLLDASRSRMAGGSDLGIEELRRAYRLPVTDWPFFNSFEGPIGAAHPAIADWIRRLHEEGAGFVRMSGSGSTVFGLFEYRGDAVRAARKLKDRASPGVLVSTALPLARSMVLL